MRMQLVMLYDRKHVGHCKSGRGGSSFRKEVISETYLFALLKFTSVRLRKKQNWACLLTRHAFPATSSHSFATLLPLTNTHRLAFLSFHSYLHLPKGWGPGRGVEVNFLTTMSMQNQFTQDLATLSMIIYIYIMHINI